MRTMWGITGGVVVALAASCLPPPKPKKTELTPTEVAQMRYIMADRLVAERDYNQALPYLQSLRARHPKDLRLRLLLAIVLREKGMYAVAETELKAVLKKAPKSPNARAAYAVLLDKLGRHREAEKNHRLAVKYEPKQARYHNDLGFCLFLQKRFAEARKCLRRAIQLDPGMRRAYNNLGFVHGLQGDEKGALRAFRQAGSKAMALTNMGLVAELRGEPGHARWYYERALRARPNYPPAARNLRALQPQVDTSGSKQPNDGQKPTTAGQPKKGQPAVPTTEHGEKQ